MWYLEEVGQGKSEMEVKCVEFNEGGPRKSEVGVIMCVLFNEGKQRKG